MQYTRKFTLDSAYPSPADILIDKLSKEGLENYDTIIVSPAAYEKMKLDKSWEIEDNVWVRDAGFFSGKNRPETCFRIKETNEEVFILWLDYGILDFFEFPAKKKRKVIFIDV